MRVCSRAIPMLWCDNLSVVSLVANYVLRDKTKYVEVDMHFLREKVLLCEFLVHHIPSTK